MRVTMTRFAFVSLALFTLASCSNRAAEKPAPAAAPAAPIVAAPAPDAAPAAAPPPSSASARAAYDAKQYGACAAQFMALAEDAPGKNRSSDLYNAACCYSLDGKPDLAFEALQAAVAVGLRDLALLESDTDLANLRSDARWPELVESVKTKVAAWESSLGQPKLRRQLLAMVEEDQAARKQLIALDQKTPEGKALGAKLTGIDKKNTRALKAAVARHGWPGKSLVGEDGAHAAWLLVQHADLDRAFQKQALALMKPMVDSGEVTAMDYAYLYDRVAVAEKRPQLYGTQFAGGDPAPIEDEAHVDERRKAVGLGTMAEYRQQMLKMYGPTKK